MAEFMIENTTNYGVGFHRFNGIGVNIPAGKRVNVSEDDVINESEAMTRWLKDGVLYCKDEKLYEMLGITKEHAVVAMTDDEIRAKFKLPVKQFTTWLDEQDGAYVLGRIADVAIKSDELAQKKLEMIEKKTGVAITAMRKLKENEEA